MILTILTHTADGSFYSSKKMLRNHLPQKSLGTSVPSLMNLGSDLTAIGVATGGSSAPCPEESTLAPSTSSNEMRSQSSTLLSSCWQMPSFSHLLSVHVEYLSCRSRTFTTSEASSTFHERRILSSTCGIPGDQIADHGKWYQYKPGFGSTNIWVCLEIDGYIPLYRIAVLMRK
jgi:hypothetical protein